MKKAMDIKEIEKEIVRVQTAIENSTDSNQKKKLENELELLKDIQMFSNM